MSLLSCSVVTKVFPEGTVDPGFTFTITGTLADGTPFSQTNQGNDTSMKFDLQPGSYIGVVSKLDIFSLLSTVLTIAVPVTITLSVPDATIAATLV